MPWETPSVTELRLALTLAVRPGGLSVAEAARRFGVSRKTAYKWLARREAEPDRPPADRSRRPARSPGRTPDDVERVVLEARDRFGWGPRKLHAWLAGRGLPAPPPRTVAAILRRHGRARPAAARAAGPPQRFERPAPNELWQLDFKGPLEVARRRASPLSVIDDHSRYLLCLRPCPDMTFATVRAALWDVFGEVGLPEALLCDNAFSARNSGVGLSAFDAWLVRLGVRPLHGRPYHPQTQGKVERFHATLEAELWPRARRDAWEHFAADLEAWRPIYNSERPHEALGDAPPAARRAPSPRRRPDRVPDATWPDGAATRRVGQVGDVRWMGARIMVGRGLAGEPVWLMERDGVLEIFYCDRRLRQLLTSELRRDTMN